MKTINGIPGRVGTPYVRIYVNGVLKAAGYPAHHHGPEVAVFRNDKVRVVVTLTTRRGKSFKNAIGFRAKKKPERVGIYWARGKGIYFRTN